jgi:hypothetical protein
MMKFGLGVAALFTLAAPLLSHAQGCPAGYPDLFEPTEGGPLAPPTGFEGLGGTGQFFESGRALDTPTPADSMRVVGTQALAELKANKTLELKWVKGGASCTTKVKLAAAADPTIPAARQAAGQGDADETNACAREADRYAGLIESEHPGSFALVVFCGNGAAIHLSSRKNDVVVVGDPIYAAVYTDPSKQTSINFEWPSCVARDATPKRFGTGDFNSVPQLTRVAGNRMIPERPIMRRQCFNTTAQVRVTSVEASTGIQPLNRTETVQQYELYNYSFQLGAVFTDDVSHDFAVAPDSTGTARIRDEGPFGKGPEYFAALTLYGLPWQICDLFNRCSDRSPYLGRDLVHDKRFLDRISGVMGVGLDRPQDEFIAGIGLELMPGINTIAAYRKVKISVLDGVAVGDAFTGTADTLPKKKQWEDGVHVGIAIDLNYVTTWFGRGTK